MQRSARWSESQWRDRRHEIESLNAALADAVARGVPVDGHEAAALVDRHREVFGAFYDMSREMQVCLAHTYVEDPRFRAHYDAVRAGVAHWLRDAVDASARAHGIDPEAATWR